MTDEQIKQIAIEICGMEAHSRTYLTRFARAVLAAEATRLHAAIMNLPDGKSGTAWESAENAYKLAHHDARHAAASLVVSDERQ